MVWKHWEFPQRAFLSRMRISDSDKSEIATLGKLRSTADRYVFLFFFIFCSTYIKKTVAYYPISRFSLVKLVEQKI